MPHTAAYRRTVGQASQRSDRGTLATEQWRDRTSTQAGAVTGAAAHPRRCRRLGRRTMPLHRPMGSHVRANTATAADEDHVGRHPRGEPVIHPGNSFVPCASPGRQGRARPHRRCRARQAGARLLLGRRCRRPVPGDRGVDPEGATAGRVGWRAARPTTGARAPSGECALVVHGAACLISPSVTKAGAAHTGGESGRRCVGMDIPARHGVTDRVTTGGRLPSPSSRIAPDGSYGTLDPVCAC